MKRPAVSTVLYALARGVPPATVEATIGMPIATILETDSPTPDRIMGAMWRLLVDTFPNQPLGLELAASAPPDVLGIVNHAAQFAENLRECILLSYRFQKVFSSRLQLNFIEGPVEARMEYFHPLDAVDYGMASELAMGLAVRFTRDRIGRQDILARVEFAHPPLSPLEAYTDYFKVPVVFEAPTNAIVYRTDCLDLPMPRRNDLMLRVVERHLEVALAKVQANAQSPVLTPIVDAIAQNAEASEYRAEALAKRLGVSLRTLQRQVQAEGSSVRELIDQVREEQARQLLADDNLCIIDIAFLLDYSSESAFRRAFKRWTGQSPAEVRRAM